MQYKSNSVKDLRKRLDSGEISSQDLVKNSIEVIDKEDQEIGAFLEVFDSAYEDAKRADEMIAKGKTYPLTGIPIAIKDNICIKGKKSTAGSKILEDFVSVEDATVIKKLKSQGAVFIGRTNMDEFAMGSSTEHSAYKITRNPRDKSRVPGGSSGGSAAAVSMGAVPIALGSDTGGSVRQPASFCGLVGLKPTYGSVSRNGLIALGSSLDVIGILTRNVEDTEIVYSAIKGEGEEYDNTKDIYKPLYNNKKDKKVIGIPKNIYEMDIADEIMVPFEKKLEEFKNKGYSIKKINIDHFNLAPSIYYIIQPAEASSNLARFDGMRYGERKEGKDIWEEYIKTRSEGFGEEVSRRIIVGTFVLSAGYFDSYYKKAQALREELRKSFIKALDKVDVLCMPTTPTKAFKIGEIQNPVSLYDMDRLTLQVNLTGLPSISVPYGEDPIGVQFISSYGREDILFRYGSLV